MRVRVRYYGYLQVLAGLAEEEIDLTDVFLSAGVPVTLDDLLDLLAKRHPALGQLPSPGWGIGNALLVSRNRQRIGGSAPTLTCLSDGDVIDLVPPAGGG
ncbi:MAG TPA: hypothetical protein GX513_14880 [Firmicutes bacterium]|nr:hypothetical protein [Bacillota bacterium]